MGGETVHRPAVVQGRSTGILYVLGLKTSVLPTSIWHSQMCQ
jgi:hypothetical protein